MRLIEYKRIYVNLVILAVIFGFIIYFARDAWISKNESVSAQFPSAESGQSDNGENAEDQKHLLQPVEVKQLLDSRQPGVVVLDIRERARFSKGHIPGAVNIPSDELEVRAEEELLRSDLIIVSYFACDGTNGVSFIRRANLVKLGFSNVAVLRDGIDGWTSSGLATVTK